jgi:hypothetical protein
MIARLDCASWLGADWHGGHMKIWFLLLSVAAAAIACADSRHKAGDGGLETSIDAGTDAGADAATSCMREPAVHRPHADAQCDHERAPSGSMAPLCVDSSCTMGENGRCGAVGLRDGQCTYDQCFTDAECPSGGSCACAASDTDYNRCFAGNCHVDSDCGSSGYCSPSTTACTILPPSAFYCHTCEDECVDDSDCDVGVCQYQPTVGHWKCVDSKCVG